MPYKQTWTDFQRDRALLLTTEFDRFRAECTERDFEPDFKLFLLWLDAHRPHRADSHEHRWG